MRVGSTCCFKSLYDFCIWTKFSHKVYSSLPSNCHHQIMISKLKFRVYHLPPYESYNMVKHWPYQKDNTAFKAVKKELSVYLSYKAIVPEDRDPHWLVAESKVWFKKGTMYIDNFFENHKIKNFIEKLVSLLFSFETENFTGKCHCGLSNKVTNANLSPSIY